MQEDRKEQLEETMVKIFAYRKTELPAFNKHGLLDLDYTKATVDDIVRCQKDGVALAARDENGVTPLHHAARYSKSPGIITALVEMGIKVNAQTKKGCTALHWAAGSDSESPAIIATLIYHSAKVNLRAKDGRTPLHLASIDKSPTTIALLLAAGAKPNIRAKASRNGWTPLHIAAGVSKYPEIIGALAKEGAIGIRGKHGYFPYDYLVENHNISTMDNIYWILEFGR